MWVAARQPPVIAIQMSFAASTPPSTTPLTNKRNNILPYCTGMEMAEDLAVAKVIGAPSSLQLTMPSASIQHSNTNKRTQFLNTISACFTLFYLPLRFISFLFHQLLLYVRPFLRRNVYILFLLVKSYLEFFFLNFCHSLLGIRITIIQNFNLWVCLWICSQ